MSVSEWIESFVLITLFLKKQEEKMGVKGLWKRVLGDYTQSVVDFTETVRRGSTLLVDGNGFLFHLLNEQMYNPNLYQSTTTASAATTTTCARRVEIYMPASL